MTKNFTEFSDKSEDDFIEGLDLSDDTLEKLEDVLNSVVTKAYEQGVEDTESEDD